MTKVYVYAMHNMVEKHFSISTRAKPGRVASIG
jgi:hypothetical protein